MKFEVVNYEPADPSVGIMESLTEIDCKPSEQELAVISQKLKEHSLSDKQIEEGYFSAFLNDENEFSAGGYPEVCPESKEQLYFFLNEKDAPQEAFPTGYCFSKQEVNEMQHLIQKEILSMHGLHEHTEEERRQIFNDVRELLAE